MFGILLLLIAFGTIVLLVSAPFQDVSRKRIERFAVRQRLPITAQNGAMVIRYLATTRRWRGAGLVVSLAVTLVVAFERHNGVQISASGLFVGWFVGAVIAEWRVSVNTTKIPRRTAALVPRSVSDYLSAPVRWIAALALITAIAAGGIGEAFTGRHGWLGGYLALALAGAALVWLVARHILDRPQPATEPAVLAADEAIRSRSLHVLAGAAIAIGSSLLPTMLEIVIHGRNHTNMNDPIGWLSLVLLVLAAMTASRAWMTPRRRIVSIPHHATV